MVEFETLEVIDEFESDDQRTNVNALLNLQRVIREDESTSRPFIKLKLMVGSQFLFCDVHQAAALKDAIEYLMPIAEDRIEQMLAERCGEWNRQDNNARNRKRERMRGKNIKYVQRNRGGQK